MSSAFSSPVVVVPSRLAATRLPDKPLADIHGKPMIVHVIERAQAAGAGPVLVAAGDRAIVDAVEETGALAVLTDPDLPSGSDRVKAALDEIDPEREFDAVVNLQGDLPTLDPELVACVLGALEPAGTDVATLAAPITRDEERDDPNVVKAVVAADGRGLYFTRATAPWGEGPLLHHIGIYAYRRPALDRFVALPPSSLEKREKLEQLRALEAGMTVRVAIVDAVPLGVDTPQHLERARDMLRPPD